MRRKSDYLGFFNRGIISICEYCFILLHYTLRIDLLITRAIATESWFSSTPVFGSFLQPLQIDFKLIAHCLYRQILFQMSA